MPFVEGGNRDQFRITSMDSQAADESLARIIDVFADGPDLIGIVSGTHKIMGMAGL